MFGTGPTRWLAPGKSDSRVPAVCPAIVRGRTRLLTGDDYRMQAERTGTAWQKRRRQPERMDDPTLPVQLHRQALKGLARLNRVSGIARVLFGELRQVARAIPDRPLRVLDVECGGADVLIACARRAAREGLRFQFTGCDRSSTALQAASEAARRHGCSDRRFYGHDILAEDLPESYDVVMNTLFLHHLDEEEVVTAVSHMAAAGATSCLGTEARFTAPGDTMPSQCRWTIGLHRDGREVGRLAARFTILGMGTALSRFAVDQRDAAAFATTLVPEGSGTVRLLEALYRRSGVQRRYTVVLETEPAKTFHAVASSTVATVAASLQARQHLFTPAHDASDLGPTTSERMELYQRHAGTLATQAARGARKLRKHVFTDCVVHFGITPAAKCRAPNRHARLRPGTRH